MSEQPRGELEYRSAHVAGISFPERTIEVVVMPYEQETLVEHRGRMVREVCSRGAFDGIERRAQRVRVNRDHDVRRTCGKAVTFHPTRDEGLVAELRISGTELGEETLQLADDGLLDASAGFLPMGPDGEVWETRSRRRLNKVWLAHIAMVPDPAYDGAHVLAVRSAADELVVPAAVVATPNLDKLRAMMLDERYALIE